MPADGRPIAWSLVEISRRLAHGDTTSLTLTETALRSDHDAFLDCDPTRALYEAELSDRRRAEGHALLGPLDGVPVAIKGNIAVEGLPLTAGIAAYAERIAPDDAHVVRALRNSGAIIIGTVNLAEGAVGAVTDNPHYGTVRNPVDASRAAGGSSGGSAAVVAAGVVPLALGTDTMGSVRIPAAYCGVVGLKPTGGAVSTRGVVPLSTLLDTVGPIVAGVEDLGLLWHLLEEPDPTWPWWRSAPSDRARPPLGAIRVGVPDLVDRTELAPSVRAALDTAVDALVAVRVPMPIDAVLTRRCGLLVCEAGGADEHRDALSEKPEGFSPLLRSLFAYGARASAAKLSAAIDELVKARWVVRATFDHADVLLLPTASNVAPLVGDDPLDAADLTAFVNVAGLPALSMPAGTDEHGLPIGLQLVGRPFSEPLLIAVAVQLHARAYKSAG